MNNMYSEEERQPKRPNMLILGGFAIVIIIAVILIGITIARMLHNNPYGDQIVINNIDDYYKDFGENEKDLIYHYLHSITSMNVAEGTSIPNSGAMIRDGSASLDHNSTEGIETGNFIVDIESLKQSYGVQFTWVTEETSNYDNGYPVIVYCLDAEEQKYDFRNCVNMFENDTKEYPITNDLPIIEQYYTDDYAAFVDYSIMYEVADDGLVIIIKDYSGESREYALEKIRKLGYNPDDYNIKYVNLGNNFGN